LPTVHDLGERSEALRGVHIIVGEGLCSNIYVLGRDPATIIDTGVGNRANPLFPQLEEMGVEPANIDKVILTHAHHDHAMGAFLILGKASPRVYVHEKDTTYIATHLGDNLVKANEGDTIETGLWPLRVIWTPGHTEGGMCLYNAERRVLFSGDTVFPDGYYGRYDGESGSLEAIVESLRRLNELDVDVLLPGHGEPVLSDGHRHVEMALRNAARWR